SVLDYDVLNLEVPTLHVDKKLELGS
ncbi:hypothetical protein L195_g051711, partial [Trifolium pratense]